MVCPVPFASLRPHARRDVVERMAACYQEASASEKGLLLDTVIAVSGYTRKYAIGLLNQSSKTTSLGVRPRSSLYGLEVQEALVFAWKVSDRICTKRLIPFLLTLVNFLERYGYLCLSEESRATLLAMSVATADRLLQASRDEKPHGLSTTKAGSLLKQQIPLRTFHDWNDAQPGFVEADLVAHCAGQTEGGSLFTLTLTDVATGWTECLPLLYRSSDAVIGALTQARKLFPFPILGIDTDNGAEFINEDLLAYCEREHLTFTRGRPDLKSDQCFVEQKNGAIVRHFVGYERFVGQQAYQQLREVYRAVRLYVNCFQPSMKLQFKEVNEHGVRRVYDTARTPLQRVLLSGVLSEGRQRELQVAAEALDPVALFEQVKQLQQALSRFAIGSMCSPQNAGGSCVLLFSSASSLMDSQAALASDVSRPVPELPSLRQVRDGWSHMSALDWPRSLRDPFAGEWEYILSLILAHPECSGGEIFRALQRRSPGRYRPAHAVTLQRGVRKIRARLQATIGEAWPQEVIQGSPPPSVPVDGEFQRKDEVSSSGTSIFPEAEEQGEEYRDEDRQQEHEQQVHRLTMTIEGAIRRYVEQQREAGRRRKTLEWHQMALTMLEQYLRSERGLHFVSQIRTEEIEAWVECLQRLPTRTGRPREASTIGTYVRSVRAFCNWAMQQGYLERTPVARGSRAMRSQLIKQRRFREGIEEDRQQEYLFCTEWGDPLTDLAPLSWRGEMRVYLP